jgi:hypothetical protein
VLIIDNWRKLEGFGVKGFSKMTGTMDKGQRSLFGLFNERAAKGGEPVIPYDSIINTTKACLAAIESLKANSWIEVK